MDKPGLKIAILSGPYKEALSAETVASLIETGLRHTLHSAKISPFWMADGGSGTAKRLSTHFSAKEIKINVTGPDLRKTRARIYLNSSEGIALFDVAEACGIHLLKYSGRNPSTTTTLGVGEIIKYLRKKKVKNIFIGLGDTGTNDAGVGMLQEIGWKFRNRAKVLPKKRFDLREIKFAERGFDREYRPEVICLCDGDTTLYGKKGISIESAVKKGATIKEAMALEKEMEHVGKIFDKISKKDFGLLKRSGSAGGLGAAFVTAFEAKLLMGAEVIFKKFKILEKFSDYDLIITSEGEINYQTLGGKTPFIVSKSFKSKGIPTIIFVGKKSKGFSEIYKFGTIAVLETDPRHTPFEELKRKGLIKDYLIKKSEELGRILSIENGKRT